MLQLRILLPQRLQRVELPVGSNPSSTTITSYLDL